METRAASYGITSTLEPSAKPIPSPLEDHAPKSVSTTSEKQIPQLISSKEIKPKRTQLVLRSSLSRLRKSAHPGQDKSHLLRRLATRPCPHSLGSVRGQYLAQCVEGTCYGEINEGVSMI